MGKDELFRNIGRMVPTISDHRYVISPTSSHLQVNEKYMKEILWHNGQKKKKKGTSHCQKVLLWKPFSKN